METPQPSSARLPLILVIDDNPEPRQSIRIILENLFGARVIEAETSEEALKLATQHDFDLVTSDLSRQPMNGYKFLPVFKQLRPNVPVIIISAVLGLGNAKEQARSLGAFACLDKPFTIEQLRDIAEDALGLKSQSPPVWRDPWA